MQIPVFAILGHPNEGKSSVVSTLTEDPSVAVSPFPGETTQCRTYSITLHGSPRLQLIDTPGFQNPAAVLRAFQSHPGPESTLVQSFIDAHASTPRFHHDCELLRPLARRAGILYVVDASRPLRDPDLQEMEILRLTGLPRIALLNCKKEDSTQFLPAWQEALARRFNLHRPFNAHHATARERLQLLEALKVLNPDWDTPLQQVIDGLRAEHTRRLDESLLVLEDLLLQTARHTASIPLRPGDDINALTQTLRHTYQNGLRDLEARARRQWRDIHHHRDLPAGDLSPLLADDLFAKRVWKLLGLTRRQLATLGALTGALLGLGADAATGGITFGVFTAGGGLLGAAGGWVGGPKLGAKRLPLPGRRTLAREQLRIGPARDIALLSILIDRSLLYLLRLMNWAHGRRDHDAFLQTLSTQPGFTATWSDADRRLLPDTFLPRKSSPPPDTIPPALHQRLRATLEA